MARPYRMVLALPQVPRERRTLPTLRVVAIRSMVAEIEDERGERRVVRLHWPKAGQVVEKEET